MASRDIAVHTDTDKVRFFRAGEGWREVDPLGFKPFDEEAAREEAQRREEIRKMNQGLKSVCVICKEEIPVYEPDILLANTRTGKRGLTHYYCEAPTQDRTGAPVTARRRHCVGGKEVDD